MLKRLILTGALALGSVWGLVACGGGGSSTQANGSGVGSGGTGSYTNGPVSGLGSIIVNNVRYDVDSARIHRDDDVTDEVRHQASEVQLGMMVEVQGTGVLRLADGSTPTATAYTVRFGSALVGPVADLVKTGGTVASLTVLGLPVKADAKTVMPADIRAGDVVEVHALVNPDGQYTATRIDVLTAPPASYKVVGVVDKVDERHVYVGQSPTLALSYTGLSLPQNVRSGARVRAWLGTVQVAGQWQATRVQVDAPAVVEVDEASIEGLVTQAPAAGRMWVNGSEVDLSGLASVPTLTVGQRVRVEGRFSGGVLAAREVELEDEMTLEEETVELHGQVSAVSGTTFVVRGVTVSYSPAVVRSGKSLVNGQCVEVHGRGYNERRELVATDIEVDDRCD